MSRRIIRTEPKSKIKEEKKREQILASVNNVKKELVLEKKNKEEMSAEINVLENKKQEVEDQIKREESALQEVLQEIENKKKNRNDLSHNVSKSENGLKSIEDDINKLEKRKQKILNEINVELPGKINDKKKTLDKLNKDIEILSNKVDAINKVIIDNKSELDDLISEQNDAVQKYESLNILIPELEIKEKEITKQIKNKDKELGESSEKLISIKEDIKEEQENLRATKELIQIEHENLQVIKDKMLGLIKREERLNKIAPELKDLADKIGYKINL